MSSHAKRHERKTIELDTLLPKYIAKGIQGAIADLATSVAELKDKQDNAVRNADYEEATGYRDQVEAIQRNSKLRYPERAKQLLDDLVLCSIAEKEGYNVAERIQGIQGELAQVFESEKPDAIYNAIKTKLASKSRSA